MNQTPTEDISPTLSCRKLERYLGHYESRIRVLRSVSLDLFPGQVYSIVGPSGCGKSTLLYLLGLLDRPDGGRIWIDGTETTDLKDRRLTDIRNKSLGFVFQFHFLIKEFTAAENVILPMQKRGERSVKEMKERANELLDAVGLGGKIHRQANHLSGGEQQRVAIARALANSPRVILADEPTGNLDTKTSEKVFHLMKEIVYNERLTLLVVTHNPEIADESDFVLRMQDGQFTDRKEDPSDDEKKGDWDLMNKLVG